MKTLGSRKNIRKQGFTFIESLYSIILVATGAIVLAASMPVSTMSRTKANHLNIAVNFAQRQVEFARSLGYDRITPDSLEAADIIDNTNAVSTGVYTCNQVDQLSGIDIQSRLPDAYITLAIAEPDTDLKRITVNIRWREQGRDRTYNLSTLVAKI